MKVKNLLVALGVLFILLTYTLFVAVIAAIIGLSTARLGLDPSALLGGFGLAITVMVVEFSLTFLTRRPGPLLIIFAIPGILVYIGLTKIADSAEIRRVLAILEARIRTAPLTPFV